MDEEVVGINNGEWVIRPCSNLYDNDTFIPSREVGDVPVVVDVFECRQYKKKTTAQPKSVWEGNIHFLPNFRFLGQFYPFSKFLLVFKWPKREETSVTFSSITTRKSRFFHTKKKTTKNLILSAKAHFCGNSHIFQKEIKKWPREPMKPFSNLPI